MSALSGFDLYSLREQDLEPETLRMLRRDLQRNEVRRLSNVLDVVREQSDAAVENAEADLRKAKEVLAEVSS